MFKFIDLFLFFIWSSWIGALVAYVARQLHLATKIGIVAFVIILLGSYCKNMFGIKKENKHAKSNNIKEENQGTSNIIGAQQDIDVQENILKEEICRPRNAITTIGPEAVLEGHINSQDHVNVYGKIKGSIKCEEGVVKIMQGGFVEGKIIARSVIIDGHVVGECHHEQLCILENGHLCGFSKGNLMSIRTGGKFAGTSEITEDKNKQDKIENVSSIQEVKVNDMYRQSKS